MHNDQHFRCTELIVVIYLTVTFTMKTDVEFPKAQITPTTDKGIYSARTFIVHYILHQSGCFLNYL